MVDAAGRWLHSIPVHTLIGDRDELVNSAPALSPDGSRVAYITYDKFDKFALERDDPLNLSEFLGMSPVFLTRSGFMLPLLLAVYDPFEYTAAIETASLDGTEVRRLTVYKDLDGDGEIERHNEVDPVWSPDGNQIAFKSDQSTFVSASPASDSGLRLSIMDADGSNVRVLAPSVSLLRDWSPKHHSENRHPKWSPDGEWIAFVGVDQSRQVLYTVRPDGTDLTRISDIHRHGFLEWSPQGARLAFVAPARVEREGSIGAIYTDRVAIYTVRPDGSSLTKISVAALFDRIIFSSIDNLAVWSPDGAWLAFPRLDQQGPSIFVARPDGTDERLVIGGIGGPVSWSPDGTELYVEGFEYAVKPDGSGLRPLLGDQVQGLGNRTLTAWSPDGSRLAALSPSESYPFGLTLFTVARDGTKKRLLVNVGEKRLVAPFSGWLQSPGNLTACEEGYVVPEPDANPGLVQDCKTLLNTRNSLIGGAYVNWSTSQPITAWDGIEVGCPLPLEVLGIAAWQEIEIGCSVPHRVVGLRLRGMNGVIPPSLVNLAGLETLDLAEGRLSGEIPSELGSLSNLRELRLFRTFIGGEIPPELGDLSKLRVLSLDSNGLSGGIPPELGNLARLEVLSIRFNYLVGNIPSELGRLSKLRVLNLDNFGLNINSGLSGIIPPELKDLTELEELSLRLNKLSGTIPPGLGSLSKLEVLNLDWNVLSGSIPTELGHLSNLKVLSLSFNSKMSGGIPPELGRLTSLKVLNLHGNGFSGTIPPEFGNLSELEEMYLSSNSLAGNIPSELGRLTNLETLLLSRNKLSGSIPPELGRLTKLKVLNLQVNGFSGTIPPELGNLSELEDMDLSSNSLAGNIPSELGRLTNLETLLLSRNKLSGSIPPELGRLTKLKVLNLQVNGFSGTIPPELGNLSELEDMDLSSNSLAGNIPSELGRLTNLETLLLSRNKLSGGIPPELGRLTKLKVLNLHGNGFSGTIPPELGNLSELEEMYLSSNSLAGNIPSELGRLTNLETLRLSGNKLTGTIPPELSNLMNLRVLDLSFNSLSGCIPATLSSHSEELIPSGLGYCAD